MKTCDECSKLIPKGDEIKCPMDGAVNIYVCKQCCNGCGFNWSEEDKTIKCSFMEGEDE